MNLAIIRHVVGAATALFLTLICCFCTPSVARAIGPPPYCQIEATYDSRAMAPIDVELLLVCGQVVPTTANWSLGDGSTASGNPINHTYIAEADYEVTATAHRQAGVAATLHIPGYLLLDDFEDQASTLQYWGLEPYSDDAVNFLRGLATRDDLGIPDTEYRITILGSGHGDGGGSFGGSGLQLPPVGPGGGQSPFGDPSTMADGLQTAQIVFDLAYEMDWQHIASATAPMRFVVMALEGPEVRLEARINGQSELMLRLATDSDSSEWVDLGSTGDLETRVAVKWAGEGRRKQVALEWRLQGQTTVHSALLQVPGAEDLLGFRIARTRADTEDGTLAPLFELGNLYFDHFEYSDYLDPVLESTF